MRIKAVAMLAFLMLFLSGSRANSRIENQSEESLNNYSYENTVFTYDNTEYDLTERNQAINTIISCTPIDEYVVIEGHTGPKNCVYSVFNTSTREFEKDIIGANLIFYNDDISTIIYSFYSDIYTYDGTIIASFDLDENEYFRNLSFIENNTMIEVTIQTENGSYIKKSLNDSDK